MRGSDAVFRIGGDEFALILPSADATTVTAVTEPDRSRPQLGGRRSDAARGPASGASIYPADGTNADALFHAADTAMYDNAERDGRRDQGKAA